MSLPEHMLFASKEDKENARENLIALQKQLKIDDEKRTAIKWTAGIGIVGLLAWIIFGKKGSGGGTKDGGTPYDGSSGTWEGKLADGPTFVSSLDGKSQTADQLIAYAKYNNQSVSVTIPGNVKQGSVDAAKMLLTRAGIKASWRG